MAPDLSEFLTPIKLEGADAAGFLHGQFTTDVTGLASGRTGLSAWCDPKGRVIATFILARLNGTFWLLLPEILKDTFLKRLKMYVLRADVVIVDAAAEDIPQLPDLPVTDGDLSETALIRQGIPLLHPETGGRFLPQELNLDKLDAVSYTKGCYPGQEIIARLRYRGEVKRRLCHATTGNNTLLQPGSALVPEGEERNIGTVINSANTGKDQELLVVLERPFIKTGRVVATCAPDRPIQVRGDL